MRRKLWTSEKIKEGFDTFVREHGRLPKATEIDRLNYLPSSRFIQMAFGGLERLRTELGFVSAHFGKGTYRKEIAQRVNVRGRETELLLQRTLQDIFGEVFVHTEKIFGSSKNRVDFYVYSPDGNFGIDVFYPDSMRSLQGNVGIKMKKYSDFPAPLFYAVANNEIKQEQLDSYVRSKRVSLPKDAQIVTLDALLKFCKKKRAYPNPLSFESAQMSFINKN